MAAPNEISTGLQTLAAKGVVTGVFDASTLAAPFEAKVQIALFSATACTIALEFSALGTFSTDIVQVGVINLAGPVLAQAEEWFSFPWYNLSGAAYGSANNKCRLNVISWTGVGSLQVHGVVFK